MAVLYLAKGVFKLCLLTILFIILNTCAREITTNNNNDGDGKDQSDPLTAARNAVKNIDVANKALTVELIQVSAMCQNPK